MNAGSQTTLPGLILRAGRTTGRLLIPLLIPHPTPRHVPAWRSQDLILTRPRAKAVISKGECIKCSSVVQKETLRLSLIKYLFLCIFYNVHSRALY